MTRVAALLLAALLAPGAAAAGFGCGTLIVTRVDGVAVRLEVEIAATPAARAQGLMHRRALAPRHGMWFDFGQPGRVTMWMKDTHVPLDMLFFDRDGVLRAIERDATPGSLAHIAPAVETRYVLEINAGEAALLGLDPGARARLRRRTAGAQGGECGVEAVE